MGSSQSKHVKEKRVSLMGQMDANFNKTNKPRYADLGDSDAEMENMKNQAKCDHNSSQKDQGKDKETSSDERTFISSVTLQIDPSKNNSNFPGENITGTKTNGETKTDTLLSDSSGKNTPDIGTTPKIGLQSQTEQLVIPKSQAEETVTNTSDKSTGETSPGSTPTGVNIPDTTGGNIPGSTPPKSRHSPPVSRVASSSSSDVPHPSLSGLGSISMVWSRPEKWLEFREYLSSLDEGEDSDGRPMSLVRYADFLQMFARIEQGDHNQRKQRVLNIADSEEDFFGRERGLKVVDGGMRKAVRGRIKAVREGKELAGGHVYKEVYTRVVDKLNLLLGVYQNVTLNKSK